MPIHAKVKTAGLLGAVAVLALAACTGESGHRRERTPAPSTKPLHAAANFDPSMAGAVACSSLIVSGTVLRVVDGAPGRMLTTLRVSDWVKPASGPPTTTIDTVDVASGGTGQRWPAGQRLNLAVDVDPTVLPNWQIDAGQFARYRAAVPEAAGLQCPYGPS